MLSPGCVTTTARVLVLVLVLASMLPAGVSVRLVGMYDADTPGQPPGGTDPALRGWTNLAMRYVPGNHHDTIPWNLLPWTQPHAARVPLPITLPDTVAFCLC